MSSTVRESMCYLLMIQWRVLLGRPLYFTTTISTIIIVYSNIFEVFLKPYFLEAYRPVYKGMLLLPQ